MCELRNKLADALPTAHPRVVKAIDSHFEGVRPLFDAISMDVVDLIAQSESREGSPIAELVDEKYSVREIVLLHDLGEKRSGRIGTMPSKQRYVKNQLCVEAYRSR